MSQTTIKDIYAGMPDAKDEISTNQIGAFLGSFVVPPELPVDSLLDGRKFLVSGYKGVGKTSVLYYLQNEVQNRMLQHVHHLFTSKVILRKFVRVT